MLFLISFLLVFISSYFLASVLTKKPYEHFAYLLILFFANLIVTFEGLSLFKAINIPCVLAVEVILFLISLFIWLKKEKPIFIPNFKDFYNKYINICKLDKSFIILGISFLIFMIGAFWLCAVLPLTNADAYDYHVARSVFYLINGSLNHFSVPDIRVLVFPFNSEILYAWVLMLMKKDIFLGFPTYFGYLLAIVSIYKMMKLAGFSMRKTLWSIFLVSSLGSVLVQISCTETDVMVAGLILSSITLFWISLKDKNNTALIFSAIVYAIAVGTKTTAIIAIPAIAILMLFLSKRFNNFKNFGYFCGYFTLGFLILSSYNYILNFINYGNIMGSDSCLAVHKNFYGIKGMIANFVRHMFLFLDFTGFRWGNYFGENIDVVKAFVLKVLHVSNVPVGTYNMPIGNGFAGTLLEPHMGYGLLGIIALLPCIIYSFIKLFFNKDNFKVKFLALLSVVYFVFIACLSYLIVYMNFNVRFLAMIVLIIAPVFAYTYRKKNNFYKGLIVVLMVYYLVLVSSHIWARPWWGFFKNAVFKGETISDVRVRALCGNAEHSTPEMLNENCIFWDKVKKSDMFKNKKILYFTSSSTNLFIPLTAKYFDGLDIEIALIPEYGKYNILDYDYLIFNDKSQYLTYINEKETNISYESFLQIGRDVAKSSEPYFCISKGIKGVLKETNSKNLIDKPFAIECFLNTTLPIYRNFEYIQTATNNTKFSKDLNMFIILKNTTR